MKRKKHKKIREDFISQLTYLQPDAQSVLKLHCPVSKCTLGAPQGLVLSPLLLNLNFNDPQQCHMIEFQMYANNKIMLVKTRVHPPVLLSRVKRLLYLNLNMLV